MKAVRLFDTHQFWTGCLALLAVGSLLMGSALAQSGSSQRSSRENDSSAQRNSSRDDDEDESYDQQSRSSSDASDRDEDNDRSSHASSRSRSRDEDEDESRDQASDNEEGSRGQTQRQQYTRQRDESDRDQWQSRSHGQLRDQGQLQGQNRQQRFRPEYGGMQDQQWSSQARQGQGQQQDRMGGNLGLSLSSGQNGGLVVSRVTPNSIAARSGLEQNDQIVSINGRRVNSQRELTQMISSAPPGVRIPVVIYREGQPETVYLTGGQSAQGQQYGESGQYGEMASGQRGQEGRAFLGVQLDERYPNAAVVRQVYRNSPAGQEGVRPGDTIISINGRQVTSPRDVSTQVAQMEPGTPIQLQVSRPQLRNLQVRLGTRESQGETVGYGGEEQRSQQGFQGQGQFQQGQQDQAQGTRILRNRGILRDNRSSSGYQEQGADYR